MGKSRPPRRQSHHAYLPLPRGFRKPRPKSNRHCNFEPLEARQVLSASTAAAFEALLNDKTGEMKQVVGPLKPATELFPEVERSFQWVSRLDQYSQEQLQATERWAIHTAYEISASALAAAAGVPELEVFSGITNTFIFDAADGESPQEVIGHFQDSAYIDYFYPLVPVELQLKAVPGEILNDPLLPQQWHLINTAQQVGNPDDIPIFGTWGEDIRVEPVWDEFTGEGVVIAIVDDGVQVNHPDLAANIDLSLSRDFDGRDNDPSPDTRSGFHGTAVAGIAAGVGNNGEGITGVAPDATIAGIRLISRVNWTDEDIFMALNHLNDRIDIYNNSFGPPDGTRNVNPFGPMATQALRLSAFLGRGGLGNIHVVAAGNGAGPDIFESSNFDGFANSRFSIAVGAVGHDGVATDYSEGGSNVFVVAPSGTQSTAVVNTDFTVGSGIVTTDLTGDAGYNSTGFLNDQIGRDFLENVNYTSRFNGTSASTPVVSGVIALMLQANPNLTYRDVEHILARSARQNSPTDLGWLANWDGIFVDPAINLMPEPDTGPPGMPIVYIPMPDPNDPMMTIFTKERFREIDTSFFAPLASALPDVIPRLSNSLGYLPLITNSAGFTVHDLQETAYGHGVVDARLAVELAQNWQRTAPEAAILNPRFLLSTNAGRINAAIEIPDTNGLMIPGGISPPQDEDTEEFFNQWFNLPEDPAEPPDEAWVNGRGTEIEFFMPDTLAVEWVEVELTFRDLPEDVSDNLRITLVSPEGTHSDFVNWVPEPVERPSWNAVDDMGVAQNQFTWTFTTMRHWGERTGTDLANPETGIPPGWKLVFQNWGDGEANLESYKIDFFGTRVPEARIQGIVGLDVDGDEDYNFTGLINPETGEFVRDLETEEPGLFQFQPDFNREPLASETIVYLDLNLNASRDAAEPFYMTGADGNYYFDVPFGTYDVRIEAPPGTDHVGDAFRTVSLGPDATTGEVVIRARDTNFLVTPAPITFEGTVFADFDGDGNVDADDAGVQNFVVFADTNENGIFDFVDNNFNLRFEADVDSPIDPIGVTGPGGDYTITIDTSSSSFLGTEFYTIMLLARDGWTPTSPQEAFYRVFMRSGETIDNLDFLAEPDVSVIAGTVFEDANENGIREITERGLPGFTVYLDLDNDAKLGVGEPSLVTGSTGTFAFDEVEPGLTYVIRMVQVPAWRQIAPANNGGYTVDVPAAAIVSGRDFALSNIATFDFGDAPAPYPTTLAQNGARHKILTGLFLGAAVHGDLDGEPGGGGMGDNDGVEFVGGTDLVPGASKTIVVTANRSGGYLQGWIDFNRDGDWDDAGERVIANQLIGAGENTLTFTVPAGASSGATWARFRYGEFNISSVLGEAKLGEVEDYALSIFGEPPDPADVNGDGMVSRADGDVIRDNLGTTGGATHESGDIDGDGDVDGDDLLDWLVSFGNGFAFAGAAAQAPAALTESRSQMESQGHASGMDGLSDGQTDGRVDDAPGARIQAARNAAAVRFELVLRERHEARGLYPSVPVVETVSGDEGAAVIELPQAPIEASGAAERDLAIAELGSLSRLRLGKPSDDGGYRQLAPQPVDAALAATLRDENEWLR